jgi:hypothetical protein
MLARKNSKPSVGFQGGGQRAKGKEQRAKGEGNVELRIHDIADCQLPGRFAPRFALCA